MPDTVVITRPLAQSQVLAASIAGIGREAVIFPLLEIRPVADPAPLHSVLSKLDDYVMVAFVSPNAIDAVFSILEKWPAHVMLAVMGEGSRRALARHGVTDANATIISPRDPMRTDSQTLLEALDLSTLRGRQVLVLRGETGRELLADALRHAGVQVTQVAAYRRTPPELNQARRLQLQALLESPNEWILTSSEAVRILLDMVGQVAGADGLVKMRHKKIIVPHARISETARLLGFQHIILTGSGDEQLLAALQCRI